MTTAQTTDGAKFAPCHGSTGGTRLDIVQLGNRPLRRAHIVVVLQLLGLWLGRKALTLVTPRSTSAASIPLDPKRPWSLVAKSEFANVYVDSADVAGVLRSRSAFSLACRRRARSVSWPHILPHSAFRS